MEAHAPDRDVALTIPARPEHLVLARLALSAVCRLTPLTPEDVADLKLAVTEAANDFVDDDADDEGRLNVSFALEDARLVVKLVGPPVADPAGDQELGRAIIEATVDETRFDEGETELVKYLPDTEGRDALDAVLASARCSSRSPSGRRAWRITHTSPGGRSSPRSASSRSRSRG